MPWTSFLDKSGGAATPFACGGCRCLAVAGVTLACLVHVVGILMLLHLPTGTDVAVSSTLPSPQLLAVVVPTHLGDLSRALASLSQWPESCSSTTLRHMELVLYFAEDAGDGRLSDEDISVLTATGGRCFGRTSVMFASLSTEDNVYPKGPSVQFYKLFIDEAIRHKLLRFDALAIMEWDVIVADGKSFEMMYRAAFDTVEPYWVKGASLAGVNFHDTAFLSHQWHILGHINGNAIYNNSDPAFVEFLEFTLARWEYTYSYDVAMWATIADFPYSWPLWQRFSSKFVTSNLIANMGFHDVSDSAIRKAVERGTMFIHGSRASGGSLQHQAGRQGPHEATLSGGSLNCSLECGSTMVDNVSTVCDDTCLASDHEAGHVRLSCGAGDASRYGPHCRRCLASADEAVLNDRPEHVAHHTGDGVYENDIMCDTKRPPPSRHCSLECAMNPDTMCDYRCGSGYVGDFNCNWRNGGPQCRFCFEDFENAKRADHAARRTGGRVIMCSTQEPPAEPKYPKDSELVNEPADNGHEVRHLRQARGDDPEDEEALPPSMIPYARDLVRGELCAFTVGQLMYLAETEAGVRSFAEFMPGLRVVVGVDADAFSVFNRTIGIYPDVTIVNTSTSWGHASLFADVFCGEGTKLIFYVDKGTVISRSFTKKDTHGTNGDLLVSVTQRENVGEYHAKRTLATTSMLGFAAPSFSYGADIILPSRLNHLLRQILLPDYDGATPVLGHVDIRQQKAAVARVQAVEGAYVPELLAGLAYSLNWPKIWFVDPKGWMIRHAFQDASVWDIPLLKPRFGCSTNLGLVQQGYDVAYELSRFLNSAARGRIGDRFCELGYLDLDASRLRPKADVVSRR